MLRFMLLWRRQFQWLNINGSRYWNFMELYNGSDGTEQLWPWLMVSNAPKCPVVKRRKLQYFGHVVGADNLCTMSYSTCRHCWKQTSRKTTEWWYQTMDRNTRCSLCSTCKRQKQVENIGRGGSTGRGGGRPQWKMWPPSARPPFWPSLPIDFHLKIDQ